MRGGAGLARISSWAANLASTAPEGTPPPEGWRRTGSGVLAGLGYATRVGAATTLHAALDLSWQRYGSSRSGPESSFATVLHGGMIFH